MATFTVSSGDWVRPYRFTRIQHFKEGPTQTFVLGELLILNTTADKGDQVIIAGADPAAGTVVGVAAQAATGIENTLIGVYVLDPQAEFLIAVGSSQVNDRDHMGDEYGVVKDATNVIWRLDITETTAKVFRVVGLGPGVAQADVNGKYIVKAAIGVQAVYAA